MVDDYYTEVSRGAERVRRRETLRSPKDQIGGHANILDTSEMLFVNARHVRTNKLAPGGGYENSGVSGDPTKASAALGKVFLQIKINNALAQAKGLMAGTLQPSDGQRAAGAAAQEQVVDGGGGGRGGAGGGQQAAQPAGPPRPTFETAPAGTPSQAPDTVFIDELTWEETRDALKAGKTHGDRAHRRHREERVPHGARQAQLRRHACVPT